MKTLSCADLGGQNCDFSAEAETEQEMKQKMYAHAAEAHKDTLDSMTEEQKAAADQKIAAVFNE